MRLALWRHKELFDDALTTPGGEFEFCLSTGVIFSSWKKGGKIWPESPFKTSCATLTIAYSCLKMETNKQYLTCWTTLCPSNELVNYFTQTSGRHSVHKIWKLWTARGKHLPISGISHKHTVKLGAWSHSSTWPVCLSPVVFTPKHSVQTLTLSPVPSTFLNVGMCTLYTMFKHCT